MGVRSLQVLYLGSDYMDKGYCTFRVDVGKMVEIVLLSFLIRTDEGNILVDTGYHPDDVQEAISMGRKTTVRPEDHLPQRLKEVGLSMKDISMVVITHLHIDHVGWLAYLPNAEVVVQKAEYSVALDPPPYDYRVYRPERYNSPDIKWRLVDGDHILMPGLTVLFTPGHSVGSQSLMVDLPKSGTILLPGDVGFLQENFDKELIPTFFADPGQALHSIKRLKVWSQIRNAPILTAHDMDYWRQEMIKAPEAYT